MFAISLFLGWTVFERRALTQKIQQMQAPPTKQGRAPKQNKETKTENSASEVVTNPQREKVLPEERVKSGWLSSYLDYCRKHDHPILPLGDFGEDFEPKEGLAAFFELSPEQMEELKSQGSQVMEKIRAWEVERTEEVSSDENLTELICKIPPGDESISGIKKEFSSGVRELVGADNFALIEHRFDDLFEAVERERLIAVSLSKDEGGQNYYALEVTEFDGSGDTRGRRRRSGRFSEGRNPLPERYKHLFAIDFEEE